jgi:hypothetical protein
MRVFWAAVIPLAGGGNAPAGRAAPVSDGWRLALGVGWRAGQGIMVDPHQGPGTGLIQSGPGCRCGR